MFMTDLPGSRYPLAQSSRPRPASQVLEELAATGCALFVFCVRGSIALQRPQGPLNVGGDALAFMVDRGAVAGQNLPVFLHVLQLLEEFIHVRTRDLRLNMVLVDLLKLLPFGCAQRPDGTMDKLS